MPDKSWKAHERRVAEKLNGARIPSSGNCPGIKGDVLHDRFFIECKYTSRKFGPRDWLLKAKEQSKGEKTPIVVVREKGKHGELVLIDLDDFVEMVATNECGGCGRLHDHDVREWKYCDECRRLPRVDNYEEKVLP